MSENLNLKKLMPFTLGKSNVEVTQVSEDGSLSSTVRIYVDVADEEDYLVIPIKFEVDPCLAETRISWDLKLSKAALQKYVNEV